MRNTRKCPKCNATEIVITTGAGVSPINSIVPGATYFSAVPCDKYICLKCGYVEQWIHDDDGLNDISKKCERYK
jgi:hypothetical protein